MLYEKLINHSPLSISYSFMTLRKKYDEHEKSKKLFKKSSKIINNHKKYSSNEQHHKKKKLGNANSIDNDKKYDSMNIWH